LRNATYDLFVVLGRAPTADEVGRALGIQADDVGPGWARLHAEHALVLDDATAAIRMAAPFCAWDAFGICAALHVDGRIETVCADCGEPIVVEEREEQPDGERLLFHCLVPAVRWWDDIVFT